MKKIINGKKYDTNTATEIGEIGFGRYGDFRYYSETLYKKTTGEFFLVGEGGPLSKYRVETGTNSWCGGTKLIPLNLDEAKAWVEENCDGDTYEDLFGAAEE